MNKKLRNILENIAEIWRKWVRSFISSESQHLHRYKTDYFDISSITVHSWHSGFLPFLQKKTFLGRVSLTCFSCLHQDKFNCTDKCPFLSFDHEVDWQSVLYKTIWVIDDCASVSFSQITQPTTLSRKCLQGTEFFMFRFGTEVKDIWEGRWWLSFSASPKGSVASLTPSHGGWSRDPQAISSSPCVWICSHSKASCLTPPLQMWHNHAARAKEQYRQGNTIWIAQHHPF